MTNEQLNAETLFDEVFSCEDIDETGNMLYDTEVGDMIDDIIDMPDDAENEQIDLAEFLAMC